MSVAVLTFQLTPLPPGVSPYRKRAERLSRQKKKSTSLCPNGLTACKTHFDDDHSYEVRSIISLPPGRERADTL